MSREDLIKVDGVVTEANSAGNFSIEVPEGRKIEAKLSGRLRRFRIRVIVGDKVTVGISPYDLSHGLILSREKLERQGLKRYTR